LRRQQTLECPSKIQQRVPRGRRDDKQSRQTNSAEIYAALPEPDSLPKPESLKLTKSQPEPEPENKPQRKPELEPEPEPELEKEPEP
jgi:hypothetical protein